MGHYHRVLAFSRHWFPAGKLARRSSSSSTAAAAAGDLTSLLDRVAAGDLSPAVAASKLSPLLVSGGAQAEDVGGFAKIDHDRRRRVGFPEVVFGDGKSADQIVHILTAMIRESTIGSSMVCSKEWETTSRAAFGVPKRACTTGHRVLHVPSAPPGGWVEPRARLEKPPPDGQSLAKRTTRSRPIGERFMEGEDPIQSTAAQRSWVNSHDPVIKYHHEGVPAPPSPRGLSLAIGEGPRSATATNKRSRNITLEREPAAEKGTSIWIDWHIAPGEA